MQGWAGSPGPPEAPPLRSAGPGAPKCPGISPLPAPFLSRPVLRRADPEEVRTGQPALPRGTAFLCRGTADFRTAGRIWNLAAPPTRPESGALFPPLCGRRMGLALRPQTAPAGSSPTPPLAQTHVCIHTTQAAYLQTCPHSSHTGHTLKPTHSHVHTLTSTLTCSDPHAYK